MPYSYQMYQTSATMHTTVKIVKPHTSMSIQGAYDACILSPTSLSFQVRS